MTRSKLFYEFSESQNRLINELANKMKFVGYFSIGGGILATIAGLIMLARGGFSVISQGVTACLIGYWTINAAQSFYLIVKTKGNDVENLMGALGQLRKLYMLQYWLLIIGLIFLSVFLTYTVLSSTSMLIQGIEYHTKPQL